MATHVDFGSPTDSLAAPANAGWAAAVASEITSLSSDLTTALAHDHTLGDASWSFLTLLNGWVPFNTTNYGPPKYRKTLDGLVAMQGLIAGGTATLVAVLPVGYRPTTDIIFPSITPIGPGTGTDREISVGLTLRAATGNLEMRRSTFVAEFYTVYAVFLAGQ